MAYYKHLSIYVLCCITLSLFSCSKEKSIITENSINFSAIENHAEYSTNTKGTPITSINSISNFGIVAHYNSGRSINNSFMNNINVYKSGSNFKYSPTLKWPESGTLSFYGYAPYSTIYNGININTTSGVAELEYSVPTSVTQQPDIMVATPQLYKDSSSPVVNLSFNHALTAISFSAQGNGSKITKIAFKNIYTKGKTDLIKGDLVWYDLESSSNEYLSGLKNGGYATSSQAGTAINSNGYLMMIPQTVPEGGTIVTVVDGIESSIDISGDKWEAGQLINYNYTPTEYWRLEDFSSTNYPKSDKWVIVNEYDNSSSHEYDFKGLRDALVAVSESTDREITLNFPFLTELAVDAIGSVYNGKNYSCFKAIEMPEATRIYGYSLSYCKSLERVYLPKVLHTGIYAFAYSKSLKEVIIPIANTLDARSFQGCASLTSIKLDYVKEVSTECFRECSQLKSVSLPNAEVVELAAFRSCKALTSVELATNSGKLLKEMSRTAFEYTPTANITLKTNGVGSSLLINDNSLVINQYQTYTFKEIVIN